MSSITHSEVENLVRHVPEDRLADAYQFLSQLATNGAPAPAPHDFMQLTLTERRRLMAAQADELADYYEQTADERSAWQSGEFHDE